MQVDSNLFRYLFSAPAQIFGRCSALTASHLLCVPVNASDVPVFFASLRKEVGLSSCIDREELRFRGAAIQFGDLIQPIPRSGEGSFDRAIGLDAWLVTIRARTRPRNAFLRLDEPYVRESQPQNRRSGGRSD